MNASLAVPDLFSATGCDAGAELTTSLPITMANSLVKTLYNIHQLYTIIFVQIMLVRQ